MKSWLKKYLPFVSFLLFGVGIRFWNFQDTFYFIYDLGRDTRVLEKIVHGDLTLVGPTTGLAGFFLGPLWYYLGVPGFVLFGGNPYGICLWYLSISCLAIPLAWYVSHRLFKEKIWAIVCAILLISLPGSLQASQYIWNPLLSVPLMLSALICFWQVRATTKPRYWLWAGFFFLALTLQSEFAYAVFFIPVLFLLIPWLRKKMDITGALGAIAVTFLTGIPQLLFELKHNFIMTKSLLSSFSNTSQQVSWERLFATRPEQLLSTSKELLLGPGNHPPFLTVILVFLFITGLFSVMWRTWTSMKEKKEIQESLFLWQITTLFAFIPYPFFMIWRGNYGNFFPYYITCHFLFLIPTIVLGLKELHHIAKKFLITRTLAILFSIFILASFSWRSVNHWQDVYFKPDNQAGLSVMLQATEQIYAWIAEDQQTLGIVRIFTPNIYTEQYDYLFSWYAKTNQLQLPQTIRTGNEKVWYILIERKAQAEPAILKPWYVVATKNGQLIRQMQIGVLTLEAWKLTP